MARIITASALNKAIRKYWASGVLGIKGCTQEFLDATSRLIHVPIFKTPQVTKGKKYLTVFEIKDPKGLLPPYYYTQRMGKDSVAFICVDKSRDLSSKYMILRQWHGPLSKFSDGAFTGSLDKDELSILEILSEELIEEAGFRIEPDDSRIVYRGKQIVSGNCNEYVHLFLVDITDIAQVKREPENIFEANTNLFWTSKDYILSQCDWKSKCILVNPLSNLEDSNETN